MKKIILFGDSSFAEIAYEYFTYDSEYEVVAFCVNEEFLNRNELFGLPIVPFEKVTEIYSPTHFKMHIALVYNKLNRLREKIYLEAKEKGYELVNYISSKAFVWKNVKMGDNCFVFEDNTIQPFVEIGNNNVLWSGNHIGHHSTLGHNNFISSHVVISGHCTIGDNNFMGVNATMGNNINLGNDCLVGSFAHIVKHVKDGALIKGTPNKIDDVSTWSKLKIERK